MNALTVFGLAVLAVAVAVILFAVVFGRNTHARENRFAASSGDVGFVPWFDSGGGNSSCDSGSDAGCGGGDGGGGGGGD